MATDGRNVDWRSKRSGWTEADIREQVEAWRKHLRDLNGNWPMLTPSQLTWILDTIDDLLEEATS